MTNEGSGETRIEEVEGVIGFDRVKELESLSSVQLLLAKELRGLKDLNQFDANQLYKLCFQLLKIGGLQAEIPRLVVFGQQSMGKTTLLDFIMGGPIGYSSTDIGTKQPIVIMLKGAERGEPTCRVGSKQVDLQDLEKEMKQVMSQMTTVTPEELVVDISVEGGVDAVFVDLPGIKDDSREGAHLTRNVVRKYVLSNPNDVYIMVKKSNDDPANWPWSLREFILSSPPKGLGLSPKQTIVVGTRARDFLINEKTDVRSQKELLARIHKRGVRDSVGHALPLFLLELFSLSLEDKEQLSFSERKKRMDQQIRQGKQDCFALLEDFCSHHISTEPQLKEYFDPDAFRAHLNTKFQKVLQNQLSLLIPRLTSKLRTIEQLTHGLHRQVAESGTCWVRESIQLYLRIFFEIVTELVTGNYMIIRMQNNGEEFLKTYGATLQENLVDGNTLASSLFADHLYDPTFLSRIMKRAEGAFQKQYMENRGIKTEIFQQGNINSSLIFVYDHAKPDIKRPLQLGQYVRFFIPKDNTHMIGHLHSYCVASQEIKTNIGDTLDPQVKSPDQTLVNIAFYYTGDGKEDDVTTVNGVKNTQHRHKQQLKQLNLSRVHLIYPLIEILKATHTAPPENFRCWRRVVRHDNWIGLLPVVLRNIQFIPTATHETTKKTEMSKLEHEQDDTRQMDAASKEDPLWGTAICFSLCSDTSDLSGKREDRVSGDICDLDQLYCENCSINLETNNIYNNRIWRANFTVYQHIAGEFSETKLLNELAFTQLTRWFKFHISLLEPDKRFSKSILVQLLRSVKHVVDKSDWEPLVADLLQANIRDGLLHLARLAGCSGAVALRRVLTAARDELYRRVECGELPSNLRPLCESVEFNEYLATAVDVLCRERAQTCCTTMCDLIFELTHTIHFDMVESIFQGCEQFEREFLNSRHMEDMTHRVREELFFRKKLLGSTDVYSPYSVGASHTMIYEEVKIQFWIMKMLLCAPLTIKLYMYFIKDIKDRSFHLASEGQHLSCGDGVEEKLQQTFLYEAPTTTSRSLSPLVPLTNEQLTEKFQLGLHIFNIEKKIEHLNNIKAYITLTLEVVQKLKTRMCERKGVNFLELLRTDERPTYETVKQKP